MAFRAFFEQEHSHPHRGIGQQGHAPIGDAHHQGRRAIVARDDGLIGIEYSWSWFRKTDEQKTRHIDEAFADQIAIVENGEARRVSVIEAILMQLWFKEYPAA